MAVCSRSVVAVALGLLLPCCIGDKPTFPEGPDVDVKTSDGGDAGSEPTARGADAPTAVSERCPAEAKFLRVESVADINDGTDQTSARLSADQTTIYYSHRVIDSHPFDISMATRESTDAPFVPKGPLPLLGGASGPSISADGQRLYFAVDVQNDPQLFVATAPFTQATSRMITELGSGRQEYQPYLSASGSSLYFVRRSSNAEPADIFVSRIVDGRYTDPIPVLEVNTTAGESSPVLSSDELRLYFASDRSGGQGDLDVYLVTRPDVSAPFGPAVPVAELNTPQADVPSWISADDCTLYLSSKRPGSGGLDVWRASRR